MQAASERAQEAGAATAETAAPGSGQTAARGAQHAAFERRYAQGERFAFHDNPDPCVRYTRDRRIRIAIDRLQQLAGADLSDWSALVTCGGTGGEGTYLANRGVGRVAVSDFSLRALEHCRRRDERLETLRLDAEQLDLPDASYDLVLVQDGLHHLARPVLGLTEMLRVARRAVVAIEPHAGLVARLLGRDWERHGDAVNFVFRWDRRLLEQTVRSYLLERPCAVEDLRLWDHPPIFYRLHRLLGSWALASRTQRVLYRALNCAALRPLGNMMVAVVLKDPDRRRQGRPRASLFA